VPKPLPPSKDPVFFKGSELITSIEDEQWLISQLP
jgi:hypothetical protein